MTNELAKTHITVEDESSSGVASSAIIPLYVFATEQDKVINESTGAIATGTTKEFANTVTVVTSKKDVIEKFGIPSFTVVDGTVQQADELNEWGLYGLYDGMGSASVGYALRADIDLKQLKPTTEIPTGNATAGTQWLDLINTNFGLFVADSAYDSSVGSKRWKEADYEVVALSEISKASELNIKYRVAIDETNGCFKYYELINTSWVLIGSPTWAEQHSGAKLFEGSSILYPTTGAANSVWIKTTDKVNGMKLAFKTYSEEKSSWEDTECQVTQVADGTSNVILAYTLTDTTTCESDTANFQFKSKGTDGTYTDLKTVKISDVVPYTDAEEGTLWYNDEVLSQEKFISEQIIKENNGTDWVQFTSAIYVRSNDPFEEGLSPFDGSLWLDSDAENYPSLYRRVSGKWVQIDNSDQSSPEGIVFGNENNIIIDSDGKEIGQFKENEKVYDSEGNLLGCKIYNGTTVIGYMDTNGIAYNMSGTVIGKRKNTNGKQALTYPKGILLFNMDKTTLVVKKADGEGNWECESGCDEDGVGIFGSKAQRKVIARALASAIQSNDDIRSWNYDFYYATCPGYPELDDELINLNTEKGEIVLIVADTPKKLAPNGSTIKSWASPLSNNATTNGEDGRNLMNMFVTRQYPPMGLASNVDGYEVAVPTSIAAMKNLLTLNRGQIPAGTQNGQLTNMGSVGYITNENEYSSVALNDGLGEVLAAQSINPIMGRRNTGLLFWGEYTENSDDASVLSREHGIITLIRLKRDLEATVQPFFFRINNEATRNDFHQALQSCLATYISSGEIYDFALVTDSSVNTSERINRNELWANISIEIARGVEQIYLPIRVVSTGSL